VDFVLTFNIAMLKVVF